ncbi:MAG: lipid-binding SYLF domain-containing protein [Nitrospirae bacterium]|nr:lipid-binding SYLF domain-containing protein [Nitrospirota bacterium]
MITSVSYRSYLCSHAFILFFVLAIFFSGFSSTAWASSDERQLIEKAQLVLDSFMADPDLTWFQENVKDAKALLIVPQLLKAAFFIGGSGGSGVLIVKDEESGDWGQPAFYIVGSVSFGLQFGGQASEVVIMGRTKGGIEKLYTSSFKLGGDASVAAGPYGGGIEGATSANLNADFLSFSRAKGIFAGISLEGAIIKTDNDANSAYYNKDVDAVDILVRKTVSNTHADSLRAAVAQAVQ